VLGWLILFISFISLGGVHRGGENSAIFTHDCIVQNIDPLVAMDVSADLQELTRCPVGLVSAGVKSILDIGRTLEYLVRLTTVSR
jgi:pseudouridylate synthase / pseudouridine kinase